MGIAFVPESNVTQELAAGTLFALPHINQQILIHGIITHRSHEPRAATQAFIQHLIAYFDTIKSKSH